MNLARMKSRPNWFLLMGLVGVLWMLEPALGVRAQGGPDTVLVVPLRGQTGPDSSISLFDLDTTTLTTTAVNGGLVIDAAFSPLGHTIGVTWMYPEGLQDFYLLNLQTGQLQHMSERHGVQGNHYHGLAWRTPSSFSYLVYDPIQNQSQLCHASVEEAAPGQCVPNLQPGYVESLECVDAERFLMSMANHDLPDMAYPLIEPRIYLAQWTGERGMAILADFPGESPALSADHEQVAYCVANEAGFRDVFISRIDGSAAFNLTQTPEADECEPRWSFDEAFVSFERRLTVESTRNQQQQICVWGLTTGIDCLSDRIAGEEDWHFHNAVWSSHDHRLILRGRNLQDRTYHNYLVDVDLNDYQPLSVLEESLPVIYDWMPLVEAAGLE